MSKDLANVNKPRFTEALQTQGYQTLIKNTLQDPKKVSRFVTSITSAVAVNPTLQECESSSILAGALLGEGLGLSPSPQLGHYYLMPFNDKKKGCKVASFVLGYKGYLQLAIRSGYYETINMISIKEGELIHHDPLTEEVKINLIEDEDERNSTPTIGYYAMFKYKSGFKKGIYWSKSKMMNHADKYSFAFKKDVYNMIQENKIPQKDMWKYSSYWYSDFDGMALKTMIKQLISKWGIMSIEMQQAIEADDKIIKEGNQYEYPTEIEEEVVETKVSSNIDEL